MATHFDIAGDPTIVGKRESGIITLNIDGEAWFHEDQVKDLIEDLADKINYYVDFSPKGQ